MEYAVTRNARLMEMSVEAVLINLVAGLSEYPRTQRTLPQCTTSCHTHTSGPQSLSLSLMFPFNKGGTSLVPPKAFRLDQAGFGSTNRDTHGHMHPHRSAPKHIG